MVSWLDAEDVVTVLGQVAEGVDGESLQAMCDGARSYVEGRRTDLCVTEVVDDVEVSEFVPTPAVTLGAAMLAWRFYARRTSPLGVLGFTEDGAAGMLREDPDIARLCGFGRKGRFAFGGVPAPVVS